MHRGRSIRAAALAGIVMMNAALAGESVRELKSVRRKGPATIRGLTMLGSIVFVRPVQTFNAAIDENGRPWASPMSRTRAPATDHSKQENTALHLFIGSALILSDTLHDASARVARGAFETICAESAFERGLQSCVHGSAGVVTSELAGPRAAVRRNVLPTHRPLAGADRSGH